MFGWIESRDVHYSLDDTGDSLISATALVNISPFTLTLGGRMGFSWPVTLSFTSFAPLTLFHFMRLFWNHTFTWNMNENGVKHEVKTIKETCCPGYPLSQSNINIWQEWYQDARNWNDLDESNNWKFSLNSIAAKAIFRLIFVFFLLFFFIISSLCAHAKLWILQKFVYHNNILFFFIYIAWRIHSEVSTFRKVSRGLIPWG